MTEAIILQTRLMRNHHPGDCSSGAVKVEHFSEVFKKTHVEAALATGIFHREELTLAGVKKHLQIKVSKSAEFFTGITL